MTDRTVTYRLEASVTQFNAKMAAAGASVRGAANDMTAATKEGATFRSGLSTLGGAAGKVGLVAAVGLGAAVKKAADFDQSMSKIDAATHETAGNMELLRAAALKAGADTAFSATEAASGIEELAKAGVSTKDVLAGGLSGALDLAAAGSLDVGQAAEIAATALTQFKLQGEDIPHVADLLAAGAGKAQGSVSDMGMALKQSGLVAAQTGLTIEETTGTLAAFASAGLTGSDAGTSFKTMLQSLTPSSVKARDAMDAMGFSAYDAQGNFKGMTQVAGELRAGLSTMSEEQKNATLKTIFGSDAVRAASVIYDQGASGIQGWIDKTNDSGYAALTAKKNLDNLAGDLEAFSGSLETALIGTGDGAQGPLRSVVQNLTDVVNAYNKLGEGAKSGVAVTLAAVAGLGATAFVFSKMVQSVAATKLALTELGVTATKTSALITAAKGGFVVLAAAAVVASSEIGDADYSLDSLNRQLAIMAASGSAVGVLEDLGIATDSLGESLASAAYADFDAFGFGTSDEIKELDAALSALDPDQAAAAFKVIQEEGKKAGVETKDLTNLFPQYNAELKLAAKEADVATDATDDLSGATDQLSVAATQNAAKVKAQAAALTIAKDAATKTAEGFINLGDSVGDAKVSLGDWIQQLADQASALRNFRQNAEDAANKGLRKGLIAALQEAGPEGALRMKQLANATKEEIAKANKAWQSGQREINKYVDATTKVPEELETKLKVDASPAMQEIARLTLELGHIPDETVYINAIRRQKSDNEIDRREAAGGPIYGRGTATSDSIPAMLSNGEYVIQAAAVSHYGSGTFDRLNAMKFAGGGPVGNASERLAVLEAEKNINELVKSLNADGKNKLKGKERKIAETQLEVAKQELANAKKNLGGTAKAKADEALAAQSQSAQDAADRYAQDKEAADAFKAQLDEDAAKAQQEHDDAVLAGQEKAWDKMTADSQKRVDLAKEDLAAVKTSMDRIGQAATSAFSSSFFSGGNDQQHGLWTGGNGGGAGGDWRSRALADIAGLTERQGLITQLSALGLSGAGLEDLLGNQSNAGISAMISAGQIGDYSALFNQRQALIGQVSGQAGQAGYGSEWQAANANLDLMNKQLADLTAAIVAARPITVNEAVSARATAAEVSRILGMVGVS